MTEQQPEDGQGRRADGPDPEPGGADTQPESASTTAGTRLAALGGRIARGALVGLVAGDTGLALGELVAVATGEASAPVATAGDTSCRAPAPCGRNTAWSCEPPLTLIGPCRRSGRSGAMPPKCSSRRSPASCTVRVCPKETLRTPPGPARALCWMIERTFYHASQAGDGELERASATCLAVWLRTARLV